MFIISHKEINYPSKNISIIMKGGLTRHLELDMKKCKDIIVVRAYLIF